MSITSLFGLCERRPDISRVDLALRAERPQHRAPAKSPFGRRVFRADLGASDNLYFAIRSLGLQGRDHVLQHAFVDDRGNVVMSALVRSTAPGAILLGPSAGDLAMEPLDQESFEYMARRLCGGARLVAFQRVLQGGLLPHSAVTSATTVDCAWRRFQHTARRLGLAVSARTPLTLNDALALARLPELQSEDAALRALAIRALWRWMDEVD